MANPVSKAVKAVRKDPFPYVVGSLMVVPVVSRLGGFWIIPPSRTDKWDSEAPYTPQPTANQSNALVARTAARVSNVADKATVKNNKKRMAEIDDQAMVQLYLVINQCWTSGCLSLHGFARTSNKASHWRSVWFQCS